MFRNSWVDKGVLTSSDMLTSKYYKYADVYDGIWIHCNFVFIFFYSTGNL